MCYTRNQIMKGKETIEKQEPVCYNGTNVHRNSQCVVLSFMAKRWGISLSITWIERILFGNGIQDWHCIPEVKGGVKSRNNIAQNILYQEL